MEIAEPLCDLIRKMITSNGNFLFDEADFLFDYMISGNENVTPTKRAFVQYMTDELQRSNLLMDHLSKSGSFHVVLSLLEAADENVRLDSIKIVGVMMHDNAKSKSVFVKAQGFEVLSLLLSAHPVTEAVCSTLVEFILGSYQSIGEKRNVWKLFSASPANVSNQLAHPEALAVLLDMLKTSSDGTLQLRFLREIERLLIDSTRKFECVY